MDKYDIMLAPHFAAYLPFFFEIYVEYQTKTLTTRVQIWKNYLNRPHVDSVQYRIPITITSQILNFILPGKQETKFQEPKSKQKLRLNRAEQDLRLYGDENNFIYYITLKIIFESIS